MPLQGRSGNTNIAIAREGLNGEPMVRAAARSAQPRLGVFIASKPVATTTPSIQAAHRESGTRSTVLTAPAAIWEKLTRLRLTSF